MSRRVYGFYFRASLRKLENLLILDVLVFKNGIFKIILVSDDLGAGFRMKALAAGYIIRL